MSVARTAAGLAVSALKYFAVFIAALSLPFILTDSYLLQGVLLIAGVYATAWYGRREFGRN